MTNQNTKETDDVVVDKVEEWISNEEADRQIDVTAANQLLSSTIPTLPWWKLKRTKIILGVILVLVI